MEEHLDRAETEKFARAKHNGVKRIGGEDYYEHVARVSRKAEALLKLHLEKTLRHVLPQDASRIEYIWHAGQLHDVIEDCGVTYDNVARRTNAQVADLVAAVSHDNRLPGPLQLHEYLSRLGRGSIDVQILKLSDLHDNLTDMKKLLAKPSKFKVEFCADWLPAAGQCLDQLHLLTRFGWLHHYVREVRQVIVDVGELCKNYRLRAATAAHMQTVKKKHKK